MQLGTRSKMSNLQLRLTEDGILFHDSVLWLDSLYNGEITFFSSAINPRKNIHPKIIATDQTSALLKIQRSMPEALICQYNRPFSLGPLTLELLPSGFMLGGSSLHIQTEKFSVLYLSEIQNQPTVCNRKPQFKKADILVIKASDPEPLRPVPPRKKEKERFGEYVLQHIKRKSWPIVVCPSLPTAPEITQLLANENITLAVHSSIYKINNFYKKSGYDLGNYDLFSPNKEYPQSIVLFPSDYTPKNHSHNYLKKEKIFIHSSLYPTTKSIQQEQFNLASTCSGLDTLKIIKDLNPKVLYLFGPYANKLAKSIKFPLPQIKVMHPNNQPPLL